MSLWLLTRIDRGPHYDQYTEFVVRADDERQARDIACRHVLGALLEQCGYASNLDTSETKARLWLNESVVQAVRIDPDGHQGIIASNFRHG